MAMATLMCCRSSSCSLFRAALSIRPPPRNNRTLSLSLLASSSSSSSLTRLLLTFNSGLAPGSNLAIVVTDRIGEGASRVRQFSKGFSVRAASGSSPGAIDSPLISSMQAKIKEQLNAEEVFVIDASGDGRHVIIDVVATAFEGVSAVNRQRMVYKAIWEELQAVVHAVDQLRTRTPQEVANAKRQL
ncbi:hypothetical protein O6H91_03G083900 [Diphasiastrum complanatum]|uniref:Uncharacterized protein n=1 Tax=Diphasiastrum complanatum TaxID=34168 RepID=A0ACC2E8E2_DIPCM|nr:hypothetical protein O6H91_03G083900 [Diphasiastrum complanatum]